MPSKPKWEDKPFSNDDKNREQTNTILADLKSTFSLAVFGCDQYSSRNQFCFFPQLFSSPGMDAWTEQRGYI